MKMMMWQLHIEGAYNAHSELVHAPLQPRFLGLEIQHQALLWATFSLPDHWAMFVVGYAEDVVVERGVV